MEIVKIADSEKAKYMDLLLIADESVSMIEKYLYRGEMFSLIDDGVKALCVITQEEPGVYELKNIVTVPEHQRKGYGQKLVAFVADYCKGRSGTELYVGTGDSPMTLDFYEKCGFKRSHVIKNFFTDNYDHPMFENGKQLVDMIYLKRVL
jgi:GNAT superfamily N-acetyltransferase